MEVQPTELVGKNYVTLSPEVSASERGLRCKTIDELVAEADFGRLERGARPSLVVDFVHSDRV